MKEKKLILLIFMVSVLTACQYDSLEEAINNDIPFNVKRVIHTEEIRDGAIVLYLTEQERERKPIEALSVAYIKEDKNSKWENVGNNHWDYKENLNMTVYENTFYHYDNKGNLLRRIPLVYGRIHNPRIEKVEVAFERDRFTEIEIIENQYFIDLGDNFAVHGKDKHGNIIEQYKKRRK